MGIRLIAEELNGLKVFAPDVFSDARGFFMESYRKDMLSEFGLEGEFINNAFVFFVILLLISSGLY